MKAMKKGRPPRKEKGHVVWLTTSTLRLWNEWRKAFELKKQTKQRIRRSSTSQGDVKTTSSEENSYGLRRKRVSSPSISPIPCKSWISLCTCQFLFRHCNRSEYLYIYESRTSINLCMFITIGKKPLFVSTPKDTVCTRSQLPEQLKPEYRQTHPRCLFATFSATIVLALAGLKTNQRTTKLSRPISIRNSGPKHSLRRQELIIHRNSPLCLKAPAKFPRHRRLSYEL